MHTDKKIGEFKSRVISRIMLSVKSFNKKHRALAGVTTFFTLIFITILSAILIVAEKICSLFCNLGTSRKRVLGVLMGIILLCVMLGAGKLVIPLRKIAESDTVTEVQETVKVDDAA